MQSLKKLITRPVCVFFLIAGLVYGNGIMFCFGNHPADELGTLSILCEDRKYLYWIWFVLVAFGFFLNTLYAYRRYDEHSVFLVVLCVVALVMACGIGLTLKHDVFSWNPKRIVHWIATGTYMGALGFSLFLFFIKNARRYRGFYFMAGAVLLIAAGIVVWLLTLGKSGLMEMVPKSLIAVLLLLVNFILPIRPAAQKADS